MAVPEEEISDIVQDAYLRIAKLDSIGHIRNARAYFFTTARMGLLERIRRERIVRIDSMTEMEALTLADEESPEIIIDMATLTGAARTALGPDLPPLYSTDDGLAAELMAAGLAADDPLWRMPLWAPYEQMLASKIADVNHVSQGAFAGSITAALFLRRFVRQARAWVHLDIFAWAPESRPGRPAGGTDQGIRSVYGALKARYS